MNLIKIIFICWAIWHYHDNRKNIKNQIRLSQYAFKKYLTNNGMDSRKSTKQYVEEQMESESNHTTDGTFVETPIIIDKSEDSKIKHNVEQAAWYAPVNHAVMPIMAAPNH